ncbi:MAG: bifunctional pyr operon transcriptional regulator/uracil phosphoribosyltransferase PyrR [Bacteroidia bacterium]|nr:bifunctional pyr operon transcriptional regulator/uracil phosphoribosyltransferase PyrR [Bacteroidia bacterium]
MKNSKGIIICDEDKMRLHLRRLALQLFENLNENNGLAIIGIQPRGVPFAKRIHKILSSLTIADKIRFGVIDPTFHRDDFRIRELKPEGTDIPFLLDGLHVILADDVLYTGRTIRSALDAIQSFGRPAKVELMVLVDRRYSREFPIQPDYTGFSVDTIEKQKVEVYWKELQVEDKIKLVG